MQSLDFPDPAVWHIAFPADRHVDRAGWYARLLAPGYRHCFAFQALPGGGTLKVDHQGRNLAVEALPCPASIYALTLMAEGGGQVLSWRRRSTPGPLLRPALTCVEACKALIGWHDWRIVTPRQLYLRLLAAGAPSAPLPNGPPAGLAMEILR